jgi:hypothetical protein
MPPTNIKPEAHRLVEQLPDNATWDDLMYEIYIRQAIEAGVIESDAGRILEGKEGQAKFGRLGSNPGVMPRSGQEVKPGRTC